MSEPDVPTTIGKYRLGDLIGKGGMGAVYKGHHPDLDLDVAVKVLTPHLSRDAESADRFVREARLTARLNHPNIIRVIDCGSEGGVYYLVMEFVNGQSVGSLIEKTGPLSAERALEIVQLTAGALRYALDEFGLVHRDIKPDNIMLTQFGQVKLADLGLAKLIADDELDDELTRGGIGMGTPLYMSPEQYVDSSKVDHRSDIYALGVTLYHLLTGRVPFNASRLVNLAFKIRDEPPRDLPDVIPRPLRELVYRMIAKEREDRPQSYGELIEDIEELLHSEDERSQLGKLAVRGGYVTRDQLEECLEAQREQSLKGETVRLGKLLIERGYLEPTHLEDLLQAQGSVPGTPRFGQYTFLARLRDGDAGSLYKARHESTGELVAIRLLPRRLARIEENVERFDREAACALKLGHPNLVHGIESGVAGGYRYLALEYVSGDSLKQVLARGEIMESRVAAGLARDLCAGLAFLHDHGMAHGDIQPANVLIATKGVGKLAGSGRSRLTSEDIRRGAIPIASALYLPPEHAHSRGRLELASDLYSLGATLFHAVTGSPPFPGESPLAVIGKIAADPTPLAHERKRGIREGLSTALAWMMARHPPDRPRTIGELLDALGDKPSSRRAAKPPGGPRCEVCGDPVDARKPKCPTCGLRVPTGSEFDVQPTEQEVRAARSRGARARMARTASGLPDAATGFSALDLLRRRCPHCGARRTRERPYCNDCWAYLGHVCPQCGAEAPWGATECSSCRIVLGPSHDVPSGMPPWTE